VDASVEWGVDFGVESKASVSLKVTGTFGKGGSKTASETVAEGVYVLYPCVF
jgi:hypothetical protein